MAKATKALTATTAKATVSHDRVSLVVKFLDGHVLKTAVNRYSDSFSVAAPAGATTIPDTRSLFKFICKFEKGETTGQKFERLAKFFESHTTLASAIAAA